MKVFILLIVTAVAAAQIPPPNPGRPPVKPPVQPRVRPTPAPQPSRRGPRINPRVRPTPAPQPLRRGPRINPRVRPTPAPQPSRRGPRIIATQPPWRPRVQPTRPPWRPRVQPTPEPWRPRVQPTPEPWRPPPRVVDRKPTRVEPTKPPLGPDPCDKKKCNGVGEECRRSKSNPKVAECVCITSCSDRELPDPLCTNNKQTFNSICAYESAQCNCKKGRKCPKQPGNYIVYYAECQESYCNKAAEMQDYPRRLAQWLRDTHAARSMLPADNEFKKDEIMNPLSAKDRRISATMYNNPNGNSIYVSWWFCNLDQSKDGQLDKKELSVLTRSLMPNEQCIENFLASCDGDSNKRISNAEWHGSRCFNVTTGKKSCGDLYRSAP